MKKKLPWLKYDMKKKEYIEAQEQEKITKKKMEEAARIWEDSKGPIVYVSWSKGFNYSLSSFIISFLDVSWKFFFLYYMVFGICPDVLYLV